MSPRSPWVDRVATTFSLSPESMMDVPSAVKGNKSITSVKSQNTNFGVGERMEPSKWNKWANMVDKQSLGAHYTYIVGELGALHAVEDAEQREHDERMGYALAKRPEDPAHPLGPAPKVASASPFTDRALRHREGKGARKVLMASAPALNDGSHVECGCTVCVPSGARPAGQPSHHMLSNKAPRCVADTRPEVPSWEPQVSLNFDSHLLWASLSQTEGKSAQSPADQETKFVQNLGRKVKAVTPGSPGGGKVMPHRSFTDDDVPVAGNHNQELVAEISELRSTRRQAWQGGRLDRPARNGVAFVLSPRDGDPPAPTQIGDARRGDGEFKAGYSEHSEHISKTSNQEVFRFVNPKTPRGRSQPPPRPDRNVAGVQSGEWGNHMWSSGNPVTMAGKSKTQATLGVSHGSTHIATFRAGNGNTSRAMKTVIDQAYCDDLTAMETDTRMKVDPEFAALCTISQETMEWGKHAAEDIKHRHGHAKSCNVRSTLRWSE